MQDINLDDILSWRDSNQTFQKVQDLSVIPKSEEIKCPTKHCDGFFKLTTKLCRG